MNLLTETKEAIKKNGCNFKDIVFIGSLESGYSCTWKEFQKIACVNYDSGYGTQEVAQDLVIVFRDGSFLERQEYDGSEWWHYVSEAKIPKKQKPLTTVVVREDQCGWKTLAEIHEELT